MQYSLVQKPRDQPLLVVIPSVPAAREEDALLLDDKAASGLNLYCRHWPGIVRCIFREGPTTAILFGKRYDRDTLPFEVAIIPEAAPVPDSLLHDAAVVLGSGDNYLDFPLAKQCRTLGIPLAFVIEYTLETRLQIIALSEAPPIKRLKSMMWTIQSELRRLRAFTRASALQANGTPAPKGMRRVNRDVFAYFDTACRKPCSPHRADVAAKAARLASGAPLRLAFSGRLERLKGADHLFPIAERLIARGINFRLIYSVPVVSQSNARGCCQRWAYAALFRPRSAEFRDRAGALDAYGARPVHLLPSPVRPVLHLHGNAWLRRTDRWI